MQLVLFPNSPPPNKLMWHSPNANDRLEWNRIYEAVTAWFCLSNGFRKEAKLDILIEGMRISLDGKKIRYLAPSLRSPASLIFKAYQIGINLTKNSTIKSSPGIIISNIQTEVIYPKPWYHFELNSCDTTIKITPGTLFNEKQENSISINVPAFTLDQAIIWYYFGG